MIRQAREEEARHPLGIEYVCSAVEQLGRIGAFDWIAAYFLLPCAGSRDDVLEMCKTIYDNLKPGGRFLSINDNYSDAALYHEQFRKYGVTYKPGRTVADGETFVAELNVDEGAWIELEYRFFSRETYEHAFRSAGFGAVMWHGLAVPPQLEARKGKEFWAFLLEHPPAVLIECRR
jgi:hypothetical protein